MRSILDKSFVYVPAKAHEGDPTYLLRKFRKIVREQKAIASEQSLKITQIKKGAKG